MPPTSDDVDVIDDPIPGVRRFTLNRPGKAQRDGRTQLRRELLEGLQAADGDAAVKVSIIRGAGKCFSSGYDLGSDLGSESALLDLRGRHEMGPSRDRAGWTSLWDLYEARDRAGPRLCDGGRARTRRGLRSRLRRGATRSFSHPVTRFALPDFDWFPTHLPPRVAMELQVAGREFSGEEAAAVGIVNQAFPADQLEQEVLAIAERMSGTSAAVLSVNKRAVHTALEARGGRSVIRTLGDLQAGPHLSAMGAGEILDRVKSGR